VDDFLYTSDAVTRWSWFHELPQNAGLRFRNIHEAMNTDYLGGFQSVFFSPPIRIQCEHSFQLSDSQVETLQSHRRHDGFLHLMYKAGVCMCFWEIWAWNIKPGLTTTGTRMFLVSFVCVLATHQAFWSQTLPLLLIASLVACLDKQLGFSSNDSWTLRGQHWKHRI